MPPHDLLNAIDRAILVALQADGRLTNQALAEKVNLSPSACLARTRRLEHDGFIKGYHARLDPFRLGIGLVLFAEVTLQGHMADEQHRFEAAIAHIDNIVEVSDVSGDVDYILKVVVRDMAEWTGMKDDLIGRDLGVRRITTHVLMRKPKIFTGYPVL
ncbi:winged helix-turn-helix transcriptional regulator [Altererythrobacter aerius]|uniref:Winged helix-turn-helix transcriptional regulator n=1 Tax=Tsuneonella aeria TaxID=1837929 RepID=A0A6I4TEM5_9SPHN|nr:Lrp/AsnC family transcriptional regulator [Tsuneonella aeria]MXO75117.1 winged helix-turn-helix transcriptional regulator [Tsuneonella aeria]